MTALALSTKLAQLVKSRKIDLSLDRMHEALDRLKHPESTLRFIHVAGTNGKGTTCDFIAQLLESAGYRVGLYTSPHLISYCERFVINGQRIAEDHLSSLVDEMAVIQTEIALTEFEILTLVALVYFSREKVDYVVWETGLGGRLDATNIVTPLVSVITTISFDHRDYLGETLEEIAVEKAGIFKAGIPAFMFQAEPSAQSVLEEVARKKHSPLTVLSVSENSYLVQNRLLALAVASFLLPVHSDVFEKRVHELKTRLMCRLQVLRETPLLLLEGAHNKEGIDKLVAHIRDQYGKLTILYGATRRPDVSLLLEKLSEVSVCLYLCDFSHERAVSWSEYSEALPFAVPIQRISWEQVSPLIEKLLSDKAQHICITGSLYFLGELLASVDSLKSLSQSLPTTTVISSVFCGR